MDKKYESIDEIALLFKRLLSTNDGKDFLSILDRRFSRPPIVPSAAVDGVTLNKLTDIRIGEKNVYDYIERTRDREIGK